MGTTFINLNPLTHIVSTMRVTNRPGSTASRGSTTTPTSRSPTSRSRRPSARTGSRRLRAAPRRHLPRGSPFTARDVSGAGRSSATRTTRGSPTSTSTTTCRSGSREFHTGRDGRRRRRGRRRSHARVQLTDPYAPFLVLTAVTASCRGPGTRRSPSRPCSSIGDLARPIGTGPFTYVDWKEGDRLVLKANPRYSSASPTRPARHPVHPGPGRRLIEFKNGTLHSASLTVLTEDFDAAKADPRLMAGLAGGSTTSPAVDHTDPLFKDARVRQALNLAIDRRRVLDEQWGGYGVIVDSPSIPRSRLDKTVATPEYDPVKAKSLLAEAGWRAGTDGVLGRTASGSRSPSSPSRGRPRAWPSSTRTLEEVRMDVSSTPSTFPTLWGVRFHSGKFQAISFLWPSGFYPDPAVGLYPFLCANSRTGYCSAELDRLIVARRSTLDPPERINIYPRFQELFARDLPFMWVVSPPTYASRARAQPARAPERRPGDEGHPRVGPQGVRDRSTNLSFGFTLPQRGCSSGRPPVEQLMALARDVDANPVFDSLWVGDGLLAEPRPDSIALLGALATATRRVTLGVGCVAASRSAIPSSSPTSGRRSICSRPAACCSRRAPASWRVGERPRRHAVGRRRPRARRPPRREHRHVPPAVERR